MIRPLLYIGYTKEADGGDRHSIDVAQSSIRQVNVGSINSYQDTAIWVIVYSVWFARELSKIPHLLCFFSFFSCFYVIETQEAQHLNIQFSFLHEKLGFSSTFVLLYQNQ